MRPGEARSRQINCSERVRAFLSSQVGETFQVSVNKIEPLARRCNLLTKDATRPPLANEPKPERPQVPGVIEAETIPGKREGLTWA
jgi:hypothetical protein